jgi:hypothetical protein
MSDPRRFLLLAVVALAGAVAPLSGAEAAPPPTHCRALHPAALTLSIGNMLGDRVVRWNPSLQALVVRDSVGGDRRAPRTVRPSCLRWQAFWRTAKIAQVFSWRDEYVDPNVYDGWWWSAQLAHAGQRVVSHGTNDQPETWDAFQRAASALIAPMSFQAPPAR